MNRYEVKVNVTHFEVSPGRLMHYPHNGRTVKKTVEAANESDARLLAEAAVAGEKDHGRAVGCKLLKKNVR